MNENETFFSNRHFPVTNLLEQKDQFEDMVAVHMTPDLFFYRWFEKQNDVTPMQ